ncbi:hypothetical protein [Streptomyces demainii]|uniref:Uncharacterized protein n=1 Tax=Streptomyces demainii TaxID=588122 RepID=A0ABT9KWU2_9ACTN|nr:hypothetical protein [Streptomyces demainii]MDP9612916.1 hypothetical protein [Streptomyces demainii]
MEVIDGFGDVTGVLGGNHGTDPVGKGSAICFGHAEEVADDGHRQVVGEPGDDVGHPFIVEELGQTIGKMVGGSLDSTAQVLDMARGEHLGNEPTETQMIGRIHVDEIGIQSWRQ